MNAGAIKILIAKPGLDGHDVGAKVVVRALLEAGFDVHYAGLRKTPEHIVAKALELNADVIGLSVLSGSHMPLCRKTRHLLSEAGLGDRLWMIGGNIPEADRMALVNLGFRGVFPTSTPIVDIVSFVQENAQ